MIRIIEVKETIYDSKLIDNICESNKLIKELINKTEFITEMNKDDYNFINIVMEKTRVNLEKVNSLIK